mgnify:FL=1
MTQHGSTAPIKTQLVSTSPDTAQKPALHPLLRDLFGSMAAVALCVLAAHLLAGGAA